MPEIETAPAPVEKKPNFIEIMQAARAKTPLAAPAEKPPEVAAAKVESAKVEPAAQPGAPKAEADPDEEILSGKRPAKSDDFRRIKTRAQEAQKERDELRGKLAELEKQKPSKSNDEKIAKLEGDLKGLSEYKTKWEGVAAQFDPAFQTKYQTKVNAALEAVKPLLPPDRAEKIAAVLQMADSPYKIENLKALTEDLDPLTVSEITAANREVRGIFKERQSELDKSGEILTKAHEERQKQSTEAQERQSKAFEETIKRFTDGEDAIPFFKKRDGDEAWNKAVAESERVARVIHSGQYESDTDKAEAAVWSSVAPRMLQAWKADATAKDAEIAQLKATLEKLQGANPGVNSGGGEPAGKKMTFMERQLAGSIRLTQ